MDTTLTFTDRLEIEWACTRLIHTYLRSLDAGDANSVAHCFAEQGSLARPMQPDQRIEGRDAIRASMQSRPKTLLTRHLATNVTIEVASADSASGTSTLLMIGCTPSETARPPYESAGPLYFGEFRDRFVRVAGEWKFLERSGSIAVKY